MGEEVRVGSIVKISNVGDDITMLGDADEFRKFKNTVNARLYKLEEEVKSLKAVKKIEHTK